MDRFSISVKLITLGRGKKDFTQVQWKLKIIEINLVALHCQIFQFSIELLLKRAILRKKNTSFCSPNPQLNGYDCLFIWRPTCFALIKKKKKISSRRSRIGCEQCPFCGDGGIADGEPRSDAPLELGWPSALWPLPSVPSLPLAPAGGEALPVPGQPGSGPTLPWPSGQDTKAHSWSWLLCLKLASLWTLICHEKSNSFKHYKCNLRLDKTARCSEMPFNKLQPWLVPLKT